MEIACFGIAKDIVAANSLEIDTKEQPRTVGELRIWLLERYPAFQDLRHYMIAVNQEYAEDEVALSANDEIVIIPPVSGG